MAVIGAHPARVDLAVHAGESVDFTIPVLDEAGVAVTSLAGWSAAAQIRAAADSPTVLATLTATIDDVAVDVTATPADTSSWSWHAAQWDLVITDPTGAPHILCAGWVRLYPTTTR